MVSAASFSECGGREYNEDYCLAVKNKNKICAMVADGLGGHGGGSVASSLAVNTIKECFEAIKAQECITDSDIRQWFDAANEKVLLQQTKNCQMKTTMALVCFQTDSDTVLSAHLGDTRIYHFADGRMESVSFDHSVSRMAVLAGEITMEDIRFHADRNKLLKALGKEDEVFPEIKEITLDKNAKHAFLLCTDGFWEYVTEQQMEETLQASASPKEWLSVMRQHIKETAKKENDNNTAIAIFIGKD